MLVIDDEIQIRRFLRTGFELNGFVVHEAGTGTEAIRSATLRPIDLVIVDLGLPDMDGADVVERIRSWSSVPIIVLSVRSNEAEKVRLLELGADDYVVKPFSLPELMARVRAILRRTHPERIASVLTVGDIELDRESHRVTRNGRQVHLGPTEFRLLEFLMQSPGRVFSRAQLLDGVWGRNVYVDERTVDVHIGRLRKAMMRGAETDPVRTVRGAGYAFSDKLQETV